MKRWLSTLLSQAFKPLSLRSAMLLMAPLYLRQRGFRLLYSGESTSTSQSRLIFTPETDNHSEPALAGVGRKEMV